MGFIQFGPCSRAGKVRSRTPKVHFIRTRRKAKVGRAKKRAQYNKRFVLKNRKYVEDFLSPAEICLLIAKNKDKWWLMQGK
jgi:ribosomal protein S30